MTVKGSNQVPNNNTPLQGLQAADPNSVASNNVAGNVKSNAAKNQCMKEYFPAVFFNKIDTIGKAAIAAFFVVTAPISLVSHALTVAVIKQLFKNEHEILIEKFNSLGVTIDPKTEKATDSSKNLLSSKLSPGTVKILVANQQKLKEPTTAIQLRRANLELRNIINEAEKLKDFESLKSIFSKPKTTNERKLDLVKKVIETANNLESPEGVLKEGPKGDRNMMDFHSMISDLLLITKDQEQIGQLKEIEEILNENFVKRFENNLDRNFASSSNDLTKHQEAVKKLSENNIDLNGFQGQSVDDFIQTFKETTKERLGHLKFVGTDINTEILIPMLHLHTNLSNDGKIDGSRVENKISSLNEKVDEQLAFYNEILNFLKETSEAQTGALSYQRIPGVKAGIPLNYEYPDNKNEAGTLQQMEKCLPENYPIRMPNLLSPTGEPKIEVKTPDEFKKLVSSYSEYFAKIDEAKVSLRFLVRSKSRIKNYEALKPIKAELESLTLEKQTAKQKADKTHLSTEIPGSNWRTKPISTPPENNLEGDGSL